MEYITQTHAAKEGIWLRSFIKEIQGGEAKPLTISCSNQGAIVMAKDNKFYARTKHIDLQYHFIHEAVKDSKIQVKYVPTDDNISDIFTKPLPRPKFAKFVESLGLRRLRPRCRMMGMCAGSSRGITMTKVIIVSNTNDHGSDKRGC